jgi:hypothetical protein
MATTTTVVFDWDCTITSVHMYKAAAGWTPYSGKLVAWLRQQGGGAPLPDLEIMYSKESLRSDDGGGPVTRALTLGGGVEGRTHLRHVARGYFLGGEQRVAWLGELFASLAARRVRLCVLTRGEAASVRAVFEAATPEVRACWLPAGRSTARSRHTIVRCHMLCAWQPEHWPAWSRARTHQWLPHFRGGWIADTSDQYCTVGAEDGALSPMMSGLSGLGHAGKERMLEEIYPFDQHHTLLVDDSITRGSGYALGEARGRGPRATAGGVLHTLDLPYERRGLDERAAKMIRQVLAEWLPSEEAAARGPRATAAAAGADPAVGGALQAGALASLASSQPPTLKLLTLNAWFDEHEFARRADALCAALLAEDADVVMLQVCTGAGGD